MEYVINVCILLCELSAIALICSIWLPWRWHQYSFPIFVTISTACSFIFTEFISRFLPDYIKSVLTIILLCFYTLIFFKGNLFLKILLIVCCHVIGYGADYISVGIVCAIKNVTLQAIWEQPLLFTICSLFSKLLMVLTTYFIHAILKKNRQKHKNILQWIQMLLYPLISIVVIIGLFGILESNQDTSTFMLVATIGLIVATLVQLALIEKLDSDAQFKQETKLLQQKYELQSQNMQNILVAYKEQRRIDHDHANQLLALQGILDESPSHAKVYLEKLIGSQGQVTPIYQTGNSVADALINVKSAYARQLKMSVTIKICSLKNISLKDDELAIVFGNLLDNAIQAATQCDNNPFIEIRFEPLHEKTLLRITNSYAPQSSELKEDIRHGFGLKNVHLVLEKHGCSYRIRKTENTYTAVVELPITPASVLLTNSEINNNDLSISAQI